MGRGDPLVKAVVAALAAGPMIGIGPRAWSEPTSLAAEVKAAYLDKFGDFVEWPQSAFTNPSDPFRICVAGADSIGPLLDQATHAQRIGSHPIVLVHLDTVEHGSTCHILFAASSSKQSVAEDLAKVRGDPVLTVTDAAPDPTTRGIINFIVLSNRVRFEIDEAAAMQSGLAISSKLLSLAVKQAG